MLHETLVMAISGLEHMGYVDCRHVAGWQHQWPPFSQFGDTLKGSRVDHFTLLGNFNWKPPCFSFVAVANVFFK